MNEKMREAIEALVNHGVKVEIKTHCIFCGKEEMVPYEEATDYICNDCKDTFRTGGNNESIERVLRHPGRSDTHA